MTSRLNVVVAPGSPAHNAFNPPAPQSSGAQASPDLAPGFTPQPSWNLTPGEGRKIADLTFINCYVGPETHGTQKTCRKSTMPCRAR